MVRTHAESSIGALKDLDTQELGMAKLFARSSDGENPSVSQVLEVIKKLFIQADVTHEGKLGRSAIIQTIIDFYRISRVSRKRKKVEAEVDLYLFANSVDPDGKMRLSDFTNMLLGNPQFHLNYSPAQIEDVQVVKLGLCFT